MLVFTFLDWWLVIRLNTIPLPEEVIHYAAPIVLVWIPLLIWLRPRVRLFKFTGKQNASGPLFLAAIAIAVPTMFLQNYLETATGKLTSLIRISQIGSITPTKYYQVQQYFAQKELAQTYRNTTRSSKGSTMTYYLYVAVPLLDKPTILIKDDKPTQINTKPEAAADTMNQSGSLPDSISTRNDVTRKRLHSRDIATTGTTAVAATAANANFPDTGTITLTTGPIEAGPSQAWLCMKYTTSLNKNSSREGKELAWKRFFHESMQDIKDQDLNSAVYLDRIGNTSNRGYYEKAAGKSFLSSLSSAPITILEPHYEPFARRNGHMLDWACLSFVIGGGLFLLVLRFSTLDKAKLKARGYENLLTP